MLCRALIFNWLETTEHLVVGLYFIKRYTCLKELANYVVEWNERCK